MSDRTTKVIDALDALINRVGREEFFGMYADLRDGEEGGITLGDYLNFSAGHKSESLADNVAKYVYVNKMLFMDYAVKFEGASNDEDYSLAA